MRIERVILNNFRIYNGKNEIVFTKKDDRNIFLISGKNGFGKTTFLSSLIWGLYGSNMAQVEDKYKQDIKKAGGYDNYLRSQLNNSVRLAFEQGSKRTGIYTVEIHLIDVMIPSIPCEKVIVSRTYDLKTKKETLRILIDGQENELTREVGFEIFINDFILPREIAKFFFFDAEKIVSLAEAKTKTELRTLSKAYSEVLGIKKYEDLKTNLTTLLSKLRKGGVSKVNRKKLEELGSEKAQLEVLIERNETRQSEIEEEINLNRNRADTIQEQLIREGNSMTLQELKALKREQSQLKVRLGETRGELKKLMDLIPFVIAKTRFKELKQQVEKELKIKSQQFNREDLEKELTSLKADLLSAVQQEFKQEHLSVLQKAFEHLTKKRLESIDTSAEHEGILLDLDNEQYRSILATYEYVNGPFLHQYNSIVKAEKDVKHTYNRVSRKIKEGEARKNNSLAQKLRDDKSKVDLRIEELRTELNTLTAEKGSLQTQLASVAKVYSEYEKNFNLVAKDQKKYDVTLELLEKINELTSRIKEEKKYSLQKSILLSLNKLMHKKDKVKNIRVRIEEDVMDIDLLDENNYVIEKDTLSKGEQQLYATALLKALVDESGINFPVFIDSPLQKFDKEHSRNVIEAFYPSISDQVVLYPLLEKELSRAEYEQLKPNLSGVYLIENSVKGSSVREHDVNDLFEQFNLQNHVLAH